MLQTLLAYARGSGIDARWLVIEGDPRFVAIAKRIHNGLYGSSGDGGELGAAERAHYERVIRRNAEEIRTLVRPGDIALVHDPQPADLCAALARGPCGVRTWARTPRTSGRSGPGTSSSPYRRKALATRAGRHFRRLLSIHCLNPGPLRP
jgi:hypothetical protein